MSNPTMWTLRTLAEALLETPKGAPINEGLARDLAREALDEIEMAVQSAETLRDLYENWQSIIDEEVEGQPLIENILYWLIEDVTPDLRGDRASDGRYPVEWLTLDELKKRPDAQYPRSESGCPACEARVPHVRSTMCEPDKKSRPEGRLSS